MHAQAGTIGYDLILDEQERQATKQASRERFFAAANTPQEVSVVGGSSTPSTAASPPYDAEAAREVERLHAAEHLKFLALVRSWADGEDVTVVSKVPTINPVAKLIDDLQHQARQADSSAEWGSSEQWRWYFKGQADTLQDVIGRLQAL